MQRWREDGRGRRRAVFALAVLAHVVLVATMWRARVERERPAPERVVDVTIRLSRPPAPRIAPAPVPAPRVTRPWRAPRLPAPARADPHAIQVVLPEAAASAALPPVVAQAASAAEPPASAASWVDFSLTREQLRAIVAARKPTLAEKLAAPPRPSALARLGGDDAPDEERPLGGGVTEVHVHGGCFRLVPTPRSQYDPFNHANERVTSNCD